MIERETIVYLLAPKPQAPPPLPPIQAPKKDDMTSFFAVTMAAFFIGFVLGAGAVISNQPDSGNPGPPAASPANPPTFAGPSR